MNSQELSGLFILAVVFGFAWYIHYLFSLIQITKTKKAPIYTEEEITLAEFLEKCQHINEIYLSAHAELLKSLRR